MPKTLFSSGMRRLGVLLAALAAASCTKVESQDRVSTTWRILEGVEPVRAEGEFTVRPGDIVLRQRLAPMGVVRTVMDYREGGVVFYPRGTLLFEAEKGAGDKVYCTFDPVEATSKVEKRMLARGDKYDCFEDLNRDGRFDRIHESISDFDHLPVLNRWVAAGRSISLDYDPASVDSAPEQYSVYVVYLGLAKDSNDRLVRVEIGSSKGRDALSAAYVIPPGAPKVIEPSGAYMEVEARGAEDALIRYLQPIRPSTVRYSRHKESRLR